MMLLSRFWYAVLAVLAAFAIYAVFLAVGQFNRRSVSGANEALASDAAVVRWGLKIDARYRLDALLVGSVDKGVQDACVASIDKDKIPAKAKEDAKKALSSVMDKIDKKYKPDALFVVDRDGRLIAQVGYDKANTFDDFELGGYAAVNDALHGWFRDDTWVWGGQVYRVAARPVEYDVTQLPAGAIVAIRAIDRVYVQDLAKNTNTNVVFYADGKRVASGSVDAFDEAQFDLAVTDLPKIETDADYKTKGQMVSIHDLGDKGTLGAVYGKLEGDAFELGAGYAVLRPRVLLAGPMQFLSGADDTDKKSVNLGLIIGILVLGIGVGVALTFLEHNRPVGALFKQAQMLRKGDIDLLQLQRLSGKLRDVGVDLNAGIERVAEKGGGAPRKTADLESILGPVPAQPAMSAFSFPMANSGAEPPPSAPKPFVPPGSHGSHPGSHPGDRGTPPPAPAPKPPAPSRPGLPFAAPVAAPAIHQAPNAAPVPGLQQPQTSPTVVQPMKLPDGPTAPAAPAPKPAAAPAPMPLMPQRNEDEEEATMVASIPQDVMAKATGNLPSVSAEEAEWPVVYEEFVKTKRQCSEPTEGLTFDKFRQTLKKNRDALVQRHGCKRVKFTVYVKDGRASLKATPVKD